MKPIAFLFLLCCFISEAMDQQLNPFAGKTTGATAPTTSVPSDMGTATAPEGAIVGVDPRMIAMLGISIEQRIMANLSNSLQTAFTQVREENEQMRREIELSNRELQSTKATIAAQAAEIQAMHDQRLKDTAKAILTEKAKEITALPVTQRREIILDILQKAKPMNLRQKYTKPLQAYLDALNAIAPPTYSPTFHLEQVHGWNGSYSLWNKFATDPKTKTKTLAKQIQLYNNPHASQVTADVKAENNQATAKNAELEKVYGQKLESTAFPVSALVGIVFASSGEIDTKFMPKRINETSMSISGLNSAQEKHDVVSRIFGELIIFNSILDENKLDVIEGYVCSTEREQTPLPTTELDDLITQFNGLLTLHTVIGR